MSLLELMQVQVEADRRAILELTTFAVRQGEVLAVLGPTGAGKSTLLRVAGFLQAPSHGRLVWHGAAVGWPAPLAVRRRITMVFQDPLLFAGTTFDNVAYGLALRGVREDEARTRVMAMLKTLRIDGLAGQPARTLSGGEAQRAALARALILEPELLLLDEPLAALDEPIRAELRTELLAIIRQSGLTCILVTHDQTEARVLADRIAILDNGRLLQLGTPDDVFLRPVDLRVARFVGTTNTLAGEVVGTAEGGPAVRVGGTTLAMSGDVPAGPDVWICIRPEEVELVRGQSAASSTAVLRLEAIVTTVVDQATAVTVSLDCGFPLVASLPKRVARDLRPVAGERLTVGVATAAVHLMDRPRALEAQLRSLPRPR
jgi:tungstate transport system ATP-binding protein